VGNSSDVFDSPTGRTKAWLKWKRKSTWLGSEAAAEDLVFFCHLELADESGKLVSPAVRSRSRHPDSGVGTSDAIYTFGTPRLDKNDAPEIERAEKIR